MKKYGFTLAEVLITLGIIGVIAAVTLPTLNANTAMASIGPKLGKAVSVFEQANQALLADMSVDALTDTTIPWAENAGQATYGNLLSRYMKMSMTGNVYPVLDEDGNPVLDPETGLPQMQGADGDVSYVTKDGILYFLVVHPSTEGLQINLTPGGATPPHQRYFCDCWIDINADAAPNEDGTDRFRFALYNDGSLVPYGINYNGELLGDNHWTTGCPKAEDGPVTDVNSCAGHVFENNMKAQWE